MSCYPYGTLQIDWETLLIRVLPFLDLIELPTFIEIVVLALPQSIIKCEITGLSVASYIVLVGRIPTLLPPILSCVAE